MAISRRIKVNRKLVVIKAPALIKGLCGFSNATKEIKFSFDFLFQHQLFIFRFFFYGVNNP